MAGEWRSTVLGDICEMRAGSVFPPGLQGKSTGKYPFAKVSDMNLPENATCIREANNWVDDADLPLLKAKPFPAGTTVFAKIGEALKANRLRFLVRPTNIDNNMMGAIPNKELVDPRFLFYSLSQFDFGEIAGGTALPYLTVGVLSQLDISLPPLPEQRAIAHILGTLDDKIELNRRMSETLEAMARALFKSWFVDFEPVRAKMEDRWQRGQSLPGLPAHLYDLFPDRLVGSEMGEIPEGWDVRPLEALASIQDGKQLPTEECKPNGTFPVFGANGIMGFTGKATHDGFVIAFGRVGAYCGSVHWTYAGAWINNNASSVVPMAWAEYVLQVMLNADFEGMRTGSAQPFIPNSSLAALSVVQPLRPILEAFCSNVATIRRRQQGNLNESRTLDAIRDALLPKLISGELRVKDAEKFLKERGL